MGGIVSDNQNINSEYDENFDPLLPDDSFYSDDENNAQGDNASGRIRKSPTSLNRNSNAKKDEHFRTAKDRGGPCEEADEEEDVVEKGKYFSSHDKSGAIPGMGGNPSIDFSACLILP